MNLDIYKLNNYIEYDGKITNHSPRIGIITSVDRLNEEDNFQIKLSKRYPTDTEKYIRAYFGEIRPIILRHEFLIKHNFKFNEKTRLYTRGNVTIFRPTFVKETETLFGNQEFFPKGLCWDDKGFRLIHTNIADFAIETEVLEKTYSVNSVNALQNYYEAILKIRFEVNFG